MIRPVAKVKPWVDGDRSEHCTHCRFCGRLFPTRVLTEHLDEAHLGGLEREHVYEAAILLSELGRPNLTTEQLIAFTNKIHNWLRLEEQRAVLP